jgi:hypothetical protein
MDAETSNAIVIFIPSSILHKLVIDVGWLLDTGRDPLGNRGGGSWGFLTAILK